MVFLPFYEVPFSIMCLTDLIERLNFTKKIIPVPKRSLSVSSFLNISYTIGVMLKTLRLQRIFGDLKKIQLLVENDFFLLFAFRK